MAPKAKSPTRSPKAKAKSPTRSPKAKAKSPAVDEAKARSRSPRGAKAQAATVSAGATIDLQKVDPPKGAFGVSGWPYLKSAFLHPENNMSSCTFKIKELKPKKMASGTFGFQGSGGNQSVHAVGTKTGDVKLTCQPSAIAHPSWGGPPIELDYFLKHAKPLPLEWELHPCEFSTGSFGWRAHQKLDIKVGDKTMPVMVNFNAPIFKSGEHAEEQDPILANVEDDVLKEYMPHPIPIYKKEWKRDLTKISGIGPWIEQRLNKIGIFCCKQLKEITPELETKINDAIKYFPGRVVRDEWKFQAIRIADGSWEKMRGLTDKLPFDAHGKIKIGSREYDRKLVALADETMGDGHIEFFEAEGLWFLADRHDGISASEKATLEYLLKEPKYKFDDEAALFLRRKLASL